MPTKLSTHLIWKTNGVEPSLIRDVPAAITHMVDRKSVALRPITIQLPYVVEPAGVVIAGLEVLRLEQSVPLGKIELPQLLLSRRTTQSCDLGDGACVTLQERRSAVGAPGGLESSSTTSCAGRHVRARLSHSRSLRALSHHHGRLVEVDGLRLGDEAWLGRLKAKWMLFADSSQRTFSSRNWEKVVISSFE